jgi:cation diffusion facilitator CzcD-associated flavoprotein CzcO
MTGTRTGQEPHLIIGAGFSGLGVASAMRRHGLPCEIVEAADDLGGNWYHGVYDSVHIISSRKTTGYPDFPMPADWPDFPSGAQMLAYLRAYAEHWDLRPLIRFGVRILQVRPVAGDRWQVTDSDGNTRTYRGVIVCNGHHWDACLPHLPGHFTGEMIHAKAYKSAAQLAGKRVLVIGGGNSACDIAVEASRHGREAHISLRRGYWFLPKTIAGVPLVEVVQPWMPLWLQRLLIRAAVRVIVGPYARYGLPHPDHRPFDRHPTVNSELLHALRHGRITPHPDIVRCEGSTVVCADGRRLDVDLIVAATGYHVSFPFLPGGIIRWRDGMPNVIGGMVLPDYKHLYLVGLGQPRYGAGPLIGAAADMLCRMIDVQGRLAHPVGAVLQRLGNKPLRSWLIDPHAALRRARLGARLLPLLPHLEPLLMGNAR